MKNGKVESRRKGPRVKLSSRPVLTERESDKLFVALEDAAKKESNLRRRALLLRDTVMLYMMSRFGLRASEVASLSVDSFYPEPEGQRTGHYGTLYVLGMNPRMGKVRVVHAPTSEAAEAIWRYTAYVRPNLLNRADEGFEPALFLDLRGKRIGVAAVKERFRKALKTAGITRPGITLNDLRLAAGHAMNGMSVDLFKITKCSYPNTTRFYLPAGVDIRAFVKKEHSPTPRGNRKSAVLKTKATKRSTKVIRRSDG